LSYIAGCSTQQSEEDVRQQRYTQEGKDSNKPHCELPTGME